MDVNNQPIAQPQYNADQKRKEPIALPIHDAFPVIDVDILATLPPDAEPQTYFVWGENPQGEQIFGPGQLTPVPGMNRARLQIHLTKIAKYPSVKWFYIPKEGGELGSMGTSDSPIYVTLNSPQEPQTRPRVDVVDFAVASQRNNLNTQDELKVQSSLAGAIYYGPGFFYDTTEEAHHTTQRDEAGLELDFQVSDFLEFPGNTNIELKGNCQDFSNLFQVCAASLGTGQFRVRRIQGPFHFRRVWPVGHSDWFYPGDWVLTFHQMVWSERGTVYDPTYRLDYGSPRIPVNEVLSIYQNLLQDRHAGDTWKPLTPVRPLTVQ